MTAHTHTEPVQGCYRCEISADETAMPTDLACAWSDFRDDYGFPSTLTSGQAYRLFRAGWDAANSNSDDDRGVQR